MSEGKVGSWLTIGRITACYGIRGWLKIHSYTDPPENFFSYRGWVVRCRDGDEAIYFDEGRRHGKGLVAHIAGVDDRTRAERYQKLDVLVPAEILPELDEGDYYWRQLEGLAVWCRVGADEILLGKVDYLIETGANDVLVVKASEGSIDERERLIPYLPGEVITHVDLAAGRLSVDWFPDE
ncbi:MAG: ribosome maturation factor RimM [Parahaliea sp.]